MNLWSCILRRSSTLQATSHRRRWTLQTTWIVGLWLSSTSSACSVLVHPLTRSPRSTFNRQCLPFSPFTTMSESSSSRRSIRVASSSSGEAEDENQENKEAVAVKKATAPKKKKPAAKKEATETKAPAKKAKRKNGDDSEDESEPSPKKKKAKAPPHQRITERDPLPKLWDPSSATDGSYSKFSCHCTLRYISMKLISVLLSSSFVSIQDCIVECCRIACYSQEDANRTLGSSERAQLGCTLSSGNQTSRVAFD